MTIPQRNVDALRAHKPGAVLRLRERLAGSVGLSMRTALLALLLASSAFSQAQNPATLIGTWAINRAEAGTGPGGFEYDSLRWVRRHAADGTGSVELRFYKDEKPVLSHRETGTWGLSGGTYWFQCVTATREGTVLPCNRRAEYGVLMIDAGTFRYRAAGSELTHNLTRVADDFQLP